MKQNKTAILIFANSAKKDAVLKPFKSSEKLFSALNKETLKTVKNTGLPYFTFSEKQQIGNLFAERFTNAINAIYSKGYETVITVGNDTPHLQTNHILKAAKRLQTQYVVLGPSTDGGFYLMGLKKAHFNTEIFLKLSWQTTHLHSSFSIVFASIQISYLEVLNDIDTNTDIKLVVNTFRSISHIIKQLLLQILNTTKKAFRYFIVFIEKITQTLHFNKGSPSFFFI